MCGICGIFDAERKSRIEPAVLKTMADAIKHRGPDDEGIYSAPGIGLAFRRLAIIDVQGGHQPLSNEDDTVWVAFNGEVYNFRELNQRYLSTGHTFRTRSDTETIVHLYEELGEEAIAELHGMFALALWDNRRRRLLLARDRLGKKPLFYSWDGRRLVFGSEIKAMWPAGGLSTDINPEAVSDYFSFQYVPAPKTIYRSIHKLLPGHYLVVDDSGLRDVCYWDLRFGEPKEFSESEWCERFLHDYRSAVKSRLVSDVPLGAFLSGGVDSSSVVALMNDFQPPVTTCSIGFTEDRYDEAADAREFAASLGARHYERILNPSALSLIPKLAWHYDEPFADSSAIPTFYVSQEARRHVTVALSGDGGDENFAGYRRYKLTLWEDNLRSRIPAFLRRSVFGRLGEYYPKMDWAPRVFRAKTTLQSLARDPIEGYFYGVSCCPPALKRRLLSAELLRDLGSYDSADVLRHYYDRAGTCDPLSRIQYVDIKTYLVDDILVKVDRASMANSLEVRCPLLDHKLMQLIASIPSQLKLNNGQEKYIFKKALSTVLPRSVLTRPKKGFSVPLAEWFRGELKDFACQLLCDKRDDMLSSGFLSTCWTQHQRRQRDWSALLWCVLMFKAWREIRVQA